MIAAKLRRRDFQLTVGNASQVVTVTAQSVIDTVVTDMGQTRVTEEISPPPLTISGGTRVALDFMKTEAGVQVDIGAPGIIQNERGVFQGVGDGGAP